MTTLRVVLPRGNMRSLHYRLGVSGLAVASLAAVVLLTVPAALGEVSAQSSISANFNGNAIAAGDVIWFSSIVQWVGTSPTATTNIHFDQQLLTFTEPNGTTFSIKVPQALVVYSTTATTATTVWDKSTFTWVTTVPATYKGDVFLSGVAYFVPAGGLPAATKVTWTGTFFGDVHLLSPKCLDFNWMWAAAVYTQFTHDKSSIGVKPVDDNKLSAYQNSDHAGTPENYTSYVTGGARGGGGSNFTGSYSGTQGERACKT
ncbi:MAG TPA: hypothetical protein VGV89_05075 [Thermoplasmata archaeon]|nr:hypothetical protein [Thermoplasmata archaeon]